MADRSLFAKSASPRELKRSYRDVVRTGAGTASSIAALMVHRPSPESETRPANFWSSGSSTSADAVRSSSHDAASSPNLSDIAQVQVVLIMFGIAQRCGLGVDGIRLLPDIGAAQNPQT